MHKREYRGAIAHSGDNLTGQGERADEQIRVGALPADVRHLVFTINSFTGQKFR
jgi:stress response protein SCP2